MNHAISDFIIKITPTEGKYPADKIAEAELHFTSGPLEGMKLIGFAIWTRRTGTGRNVTFPARQYSVNGERRSFALLRPISNVLNQDRIRTMILEAYQEAHQADDPHCTCNDCIAAFDATKKQPEPTRAKETPSPVYTGQLPEPAALDYTSDQAARTEPPAPEKGLQVLATDEAERARPVHGNIPEDRRPLHMQNVPAQRRIVF